MSLSADGSEGESERVNASVRSQVFKFFFWGGAYGGWFISMTRCQDLETLFLTLSLSLSSSSIYDIYSTAAYFFSRQKKKTFDMTTFSTVLLLGQLTINKMWNLVLFCSNTNHEIPTEKWKCFILSWETKTLFYTIRFVQTQIINLFNFTNSYKNNPIQ